MRTELIHSLKQRVEDQRKNCFELIQVCKGQYEQSTVYYNNFLQLEAA